MDQGPRRRPFRPQRNQNQQRPAHPRPSGIRPPGNPRQAAANARNNYEQYTNLAKDAARRGEIIEAENLYQHAEHYFRMMREQEQPLRMCNLYSVRTSLTPRETSVLRLASTGAQTHAIAQELGLGEETVRSHVMKAQTKLGARSRAHAVAEALRQRLIP